MNEEFGDGLDRIIQDLTRRIQKLEAGQRSGPGLQIGQASGPFLIPSTSTPSTPPSGVYLYVSGSTARWRSSSGADYSLVPPTFPQAVPITNQANLETPASAPASYTQTWGQQVRNDLAAGRTYGFDLTTILRNTTPRIIDI